ncbi:hypothetical protein RDWZM_000179, partial [Blomia tropicalis]
CFESRVKSIDFRLLSMGIPPAKSFIVHNMVIVDLNAIKISAAILNSIDYVVWRNKHRITEHTIHQTCVAD